MSKMRIAVIGADQLDPHHHQALNHLADQDRIAAFALDCPPPESGFEPLRRAMQEDALDAIILAGPRADLRAWTSFALAQGWPIYCTHAVPQSVEDLIEIRRVEQDAAASLLQFGATARHHDSAIAALAKADTGDYGELLTLRAVCGINELSHEDELIYELGAQMIDLMHAFAGPFQDISGISDHDHFPDPGTVRNMLMTLRSPTGALASVHFSATQWRPTFRLELGFEHGYMWLEGLNHPSLNFGQETLVYARTDDQQASHETVERFEQSDGARTALEKFLARIGNRQASPALGTSQDAFDTLNTLQRLLAADQTLAPQLERQAS
jgi:predicted dehydrogenase